MPWFARALLRQRWRRHRPTRVRSRKLVMCWRLGAELVLRGVSNSLRLGVFWHPGTNELRPRRVVLRRGFLRPYRVRLEVRRPSVVTPLGPRPRPSAPSLGGSAQKFRIVSSARPGLTLWTEHGRRLPGWTATEARAPARIRSPSSSFADSRSSSPTPASCSRHSRTTGALTRISRRRAAPSLRSTAETATQPSAFLKGAWSN